MATVGITREARRATLTRFRSNEGSERPLRTPEKIPTLIVAADAARARLLIADPESKGLRELDELLNPEARLHEGDLVADSAGRRNHASTSGGHPAPGGGSMKRHHIEDFAARVCKRIELCLEENCARRVYIIAEPEFLGLLRRQARPRLARSFAGEVARSLASASLAEIRAALPIRL